MSTLVEIANKLENCGGDQANTGKLGCLQAFGTPLSAILTKNGFVIPKTQELTIAYLELQVQNGNLIPLIDASSFEDVSGEDAYSTNAAGVERLNLQGLPKYKLMFEEGHEFYRQMSKLTSYKSKGAILIDDAGRWLFGINSDGDFVGLTLGQVTAEMRKTKVQGGDAESKAVSMQFTDRYQWDYSYGIVERAELGFGASEVPTINGVTIKSLTPITASSTSVNFSVTFDSDGSPVEGLLDGGDWSFANNGSFRSPGVITETQAGVYNITLFAAYSAGTLDIRLFDSGVSDDVANSNGILYRSNLLTEVVSA